MPTSFWTLCDPPVVTVGAPAIGSCTINWGAVTGAVSYNVYRDDGHGGAFTELAAGVMALTYTDDTGDEGLTYRFKVRAVNATPAESADSNIVFNTDDAPTTPQYVFSTASLVAYPRTDVQPAVLLSGAPLSAKRVNNSGGGITGTAANTVDGNLATSGSINAHVNGADASICDWLEIALSEPYSVADLAVNVDTGFGPTIKAWAASIAGLAPGAVGTTLIGTVVSIAGANTITPALAVAARYVLIEAVDADAFSVVIKEITAHVYPGIVFGVMQSADHTHGFTRKELYGPAWQSIFPVAVADSDGVVDLKIGYAGIDVYALNLLIADTLIVLLNEDDSLRAEELAIFDDLELPAFQAELVFKSITGRTVKFIYLNVKSKGMPIPIKQADFTMPDFTVGCYPDARGNVYVVSQSA